MHVWHSRITFIFSEVMMVSIGEMTSISIILRLIHGVSSLLMKNLLPLEIDTLQVSI
jgi:hypothetical protein